MTRIYKVTLMVIDHGGIGRDEITTVLENTRYANHCIDPRVVASESRDVDWDDDDPINRADGWRNAFEDLFSCEHHPTDDEDSITHLTRRDGAERKAICGATVMAADMSCDVECGDIGLANLLARRESTAKLCRSCFKIHDGRDLDDDLNRKAVR